MDQENPVILNKKVDKSTDDSERALLAQAYQHRAGVKNATQFNGTGNSSYVKKTLIATCFIPIGSVIAACFTIYLGHKALKETKNNQVKGRRTAIICLTLAYLVLTPVVSLFVLKLIR